MCTNYSPPTSTCVNSKLLINTLRIIILIIVLIIILIIIISYLQYEEDSSALWVTQQTGIIKSTRSRRLNGNWGDAWANYNYVTVQSTDPLSLLISGMAVQSAGQSAKRKKSRIK